jgi:ribosomal protein S18 acetylase RimI-like enzyme
MESGPSEVEYRQLRKADLASYDGLLTQGMGPLEKATGLDEVSMQQFGSLKRPLVWMAFSAARAVGRAPINILVGAAPDRVLGTASVLLLEKAGYVVGVATDSSARRRGIATHLLEQIEALARRKGKSWLALDVESDNSVASGVYAKLGFEERARYDWYAGPLPPPQSEREVSVVEVPQGRCAELVPWVGQHLPSAVTEPLPPTQRRFAHFELMTRGFRAPGRTWRISISDQAAGVLRGSYLSAANAGYLIPIGFDPSLTGERRATMTSPAMDWFRSLGATRAVAAVLEPAGEWNAVLVTLGLKKAVSTTLMAKRLA